MGFVTALIGLGVAVGTGAMRMPMSATAAKTRDAVTAPQATATEPGVSAYSYHLAALPSNWAEDQHSAQPTPSRTAAPKPRPTATPTVAPSSPQATHTTQAAPSTTPAASPTPSSSQTTASSSGLTPQPTAEYQTPTGQNQLAWSEAILTALGDPLTSANIESIGYWMQNEAGSPPYGIVGANNPINVSEPGYGGTQIQYEAPGYYLMSYPSVAEGVAATAAYLNSGSYPEILSDLKQGIGLMTDSGLASELSEYSGGGYSTIPDSWGQSQGTPLS